MPASTLTPRTLHGRSLWEVLKQVSLFFHGKDEVFKTLRRLAKRLDKAAIPYDYIECLEEKHREDEYEARN